MESRRAGSYPDGPNLDPVRAAYRQILDEVPATRAGRRLPSLAAGRVQHPDDRLLQRGVVHAGDPALDRRAGEALRREWERQGG